MKKLGEFLNRVEKDHAIAAEFYSPGHTPGTDDRQVEINLEPGSHDISETAKNYLGGYAKEISNESNTLNAHTGQIYTETSQQDFRARSKFDLTSRNDARLRNLIRRQDFGSFEPSSNDDYYGDSSSSRPSGHNLLSKYVKSNSSGNLKSTAYAETVGDDRFVNGAVQRTLDLNNLHAPGRASITESGMEDESLRDGMYSLQNGNFGKFNKDAKRVAVEDMNKAVNAILNNARGVNESSSSGLDQIGDFLAPTIAVIQGMNDLRISNVADIISKFGNGISGQDDIARVRNEFSFLYDGGQTYGHLSTPSQPFNGIPFGMALTGYAGMLALRVVYELYKLLIDLVIAVIAKTKDPDFGVGNQILGAVMPTAYFTVVNELGINSSISDYGNPQISNINVMDKIDIWKKLTGKSNLDDLFEAGFNEFYGYMPSSDGLVASIANAANPLSYKKIFQTPGYYATISRMILRDATLITDVARDTRGSGSAGEAANVMTDFFLNVSSSFSFKMCIQLIKLGLQLKTKNFVQSTNAVLDVSESVKTKERAGKLILQRNLNSMEYFRFSSGDSRKSLTSLSSFPVLQFVQSNTAPVAAGNLNFIKAEDANKIRFTPDQVNEIESVIDGDYIPFSIQDVRTNEIISLPAFIDNVNDSFNVSYESSHGYGRTDPVHSYSKTERNISLSFVLVGLNESDHQIVYDTVNRLTSMCYPQRSAGTKRTDGALSFTQPFSQIPTASPLVRIRLGDLLRNNQTKSAFQWIFGADKNFENQSKLLQEKARKEKFLKDFFEGNLKSGETFKMNGIPFPKIFYNDENHLDISNTQSSVNYADAKELKIESFYDGTKNDKPLFIAGNIKTTISNNGVNTAYKLVNDKTFTEKAYEFFANNNKKKMYHLTSGNDTYVAVLDDQSRDWMSKLTYIGLENSEQELSFYSPETNAIVRSFKSTSGRGLAGFIKDLQLDYSGFNWGDRLKAPLGVKINITFAPIHDMPLGLDHNGRMIAPTHMVGIPHYN